MMSEAGLVAAAHASFVGSFRKLAEHCAESAVREGGGVFAFTTGLPVSLFNGCVVAAPTTEVEFDAALAWVRERGLPYRVWVHEASAPGLSGVAASRGLELDPLPYPGMVLHPIPEPAAPARDVMVVPVAGAGAALEAYLDVNIEGGMPPELAGRIFPSSVATDPDVRLFMARLEGRPVGTAMAIRTGDVSGVYAVGTVEAARRRGVGTALTWAAVAAGVSWGCHTVVLQASKMGFSVYEAMGFRAVAPYATFRPPAAP